MNAATRGTHLLSRLPPVRGRISTDVPLGPMTWFRVGGTADILFRPADSEDLSQFLAACPADIPVLVIGVASNLLVRDGGIDGVVIRLGGAFAQVECDGDRIRAGAGALDLTVAQTACQAGLGGLEFLSGIPGSLGGAIRMNGGAYGRELADVIISADAVDRTGRRLTLDRDGLGLSYRHCAAPEDLIFTGCILQGTPTDPAVIQTRMEDIATARADSQPIRSRTGGSTFANPPGHKAWQLIDAAGCRGLEHGDAQVSEKHCNFLINRGQASAADIEALGEEVRRRVLDRTGVDLRWEIKRVGRPDDSTVSREFRG
jgi:UDP-N-acetylmuramate dehydrogenase